MVVKVHIGGPRVVGYMLLFVLSLIEYLDVRRVDAIMLNYRATSEKPATAHRPNKFFKSRAENSENTTEVPTYIF